MPTVAQRNESTGVRIHPPAALGHTAACGGGWGPVLAGCGDTQTGADIAALDVTLRHNFPHGGRCPKGRKSLDGPIPARYQLSETPSASYLQRTEWNVRDSDGTVVFTYAKEPTGGSLKTIQFAKKHGKPSLHIGRAGITYTSELALQEFVKQHGIKNTVRVAAAQKRARKS